MKKSLLRYAWSILLLSIVHTAARAGGLEDQKKELAKAEDRLRNAAATEIQRVARGYLAKKTLKEQELENCQKDRVDLAPSPLDSLLSFQPMLGPIYCLPQEFSDNPLIQAFLEEDRIDFRTQFKKTETLIDERPELLMTPDAEGRVAAKVAFDKSDRLFNKIIRHYPDALFVQDSKGRTILHRLAEQAGPASIYDETTNKAQNGLVLLIAQLPLLANIQDQDGTTVAHLAVRKGLDKVLNGLETHSPAIFRILDDKGNSPAHELNEGNLEAFKTMTDLIKRCAPETFLLKNQENPSVYPIERFVSQPLYWTVFGSQTYVDGDKLLYLAIQSPTTITFELISKVKSVVFSPRHLARLRDLSVKPARESSGRVESVPPEQRDHEALNEITQIFGEEGIRVAFAVPHHQMNWNGELSRRYLNFCLLVDQSNRIPADEAAYGKIQFSQKDLRLNLLNR